MDKKCDLCGEPASVMIEEIIDGKRKKICLCAKCYFEKFISKKIDEEIDKMMKSGKKSGASFIKIVPENLVPVDDDDDDLDVPADDDFDDDSGDDAGDDAGENDVPADDENGVPADDSRDEILFEEDDVPFEIQDEDPKKVCDFCGTKFSDFLKNRRVGCAHCYKKFAKAIERDLLIMHSANRHLALIGGENRRKKLHSQDDLQTLYQRAIAEENYEEAIRLRDLMNAGTQNFRSRENENFRKKEKGKRKKDDEKRVPAGEKKTRSRGRPRKNVPKKGDENGK